ncbi:MAG: VWA domain-containing protein, partial [Clostridia bacterium]|nr:VWA domain-containing protein [Clostridia bacterium]
GGDSSVPKTDYGGEGEPGSLSTKAVSDFYFSMDGKEMISGYYDVPGVVVEPTVGPDKPADTPQTAPGTLTAGRWNDNNNFEFWKSVLNKNDWYSIAETWKLFASHRAVFVMKTTDGRLVKGAAFTAYDADGKKLGTAVTDSYGIAYVYYDVRNGSSDAAPATYSYSLKYAGNEYSGRGDVTENAAVVTVDISPAASAKKLDLMFVIDTTGSMGDELRYIQTELYDVIAKVKANFEQNVSIRLSVNFYRDHGDTYVVSSNKFTTDISAAVAELAKQYSDGGGDYPEAVDEALEDAVKNHDWDADAVKLMFFVLDAPPHSDRQGTPERIYENVLLAAENGIRIIPVASSGVDTETELIMRSLAAITGGTYVFLTNDSGIGGDHLEPTIGDYEVEKLNDLMVDLISRYLMDLSENAVSQSAD